MMDVSTEYLSFATIKKQIRASVVRLPIVMSPENVFMLHIPHNFIVNAKPPFSITTVSIQVEHVNRIVPFVCRVTMVIEHPIERVAPWRCASWILGNGYHDV